MIDLDVDAPISTGAAPGPFDGLESAKPNEPVFTLQGGDPDAADLVLEWVARRRARALASRSDGGRNDADADLARCTHAETIAWAMQEYRRGGGTETVEPSEPLVGYSSGTETPEAQAVRERSSVLIECKDHISEAAFHANEAATKLDAIDHPSKALRVIVATLKDIGEIVRPARRHRG